MRKTLTLFVFLIFVFSLTISAHASNTLRVFYAGEPGTVKESLALADEGTFTLVTDPTQADVFLLNGEIPQVEVIAAQVQRGAGVVLILGEGVTAGQVSALLGVPVSLTFAEEPLSLTGAKDVTDALTTEIVWNGSPQIRERYQVSGGLTPLATGFETGEIVLGQTKAGNGEIFVFTGVLNGDANPQIKDWAYFHYMIYALTVRAGSQSPLAFADYAGSPVPHSSERNALFGLMLLIAVSSFGVFFFVRRYSLRHPEALDALVEDRARFDTREAGTDWENIGFHRPLGGFLVALAFGLVLFIPLILYQNLILPTFILPSAQALGIWGRVTQFFNLAWFFFDMGTGVAAVKYLSEYRVRDPKKGIKFLQFFVWWQALTGAFQVAVVIGLASTIAPRTAFALYAWSVIIHAMIQVPGFFGVYRNAFGGFQRSDYSRLLDLSTSLIMPMLVQPVVVSIAYFWGQNNPVFGGSMGGLLGMGVAAYLIEFFTFLWGMWLFKRIGYNNRVLFMAHFDWETVKSSLGFGVFEMLGSAAWSAGQAAEIWITQTRLVNYAEIWGNWVIAQNFIFAFNVTQTLNDGVMPAISEALSNGRKTLSQYYAVMAYKFNGLGSGFIAAVLLAVADRFILGATGPEFARAAQYVIPLTIWGAFQYPSWVGDTVQLGANKPYFKTILIAAEQTVRIALGILLIAQFQVTGLVIAYFVGLFSKGITAYFVNDRLVFKQRFYWWQSLFVPVLAAGAHYLVLRWLTGLIWLGDQITSVLIFFIAILPSFPLYMFFYGLFGGWEQSGLAELLEAVKLAGVARWLSYWGLYTPTLLGARISPLTGRFPITIRAEAMKQAEELTKEKVKL